MKKIIIIDGGPRRNMNTAQMLQKFAEGAQSVALYTLGGGPAEGIQGRISDGKPTVTK
jgi:multimeric flavodoxin WrbA